MSANLFPCAHCGGAADAWRYGSARGGPSHAVGCKTCGISTAWLPSGHEAIADWNRRTPVPAQTGTSAPDLRALATAIPTTPEQVVAFIGANFGSWQANGELADYRYVLTVRDLLSAFGDMTSSIAELAGPAPATGEAADSQDALDAERYRHLRDKMCFTSSRIEAPTMTLSARLPAPEHEPNKDWMGERFDASVDRTVDASIAAAKEAT